MEKSQECLEYLRKKIEEKEDLIKILNALQGTLVMDIFEIMLTGKIAGNVYKPNSFRLSDFEVIGTETANDFERACYTLLWEVSDKAERLGWDLNSLITTKEGKEGIRMKIRCCQEEIVAINGLLWSSVRRRLGCYCENKMDLLKDFKIGIQAGSCDKCHKRKEDKISTALH